MNSSSTRWPKGWNHASFVPDPENQRLHLSAFRHQFRIVPHPDKGRRFRDPHDGPGREHPLGEIRRAILVPRESGHHASNVGLCRWAESNFVTTSTYCLLPKLGHPVQAFLLVGYGHIPFPKTPRLPIQPTRILCSFILPF